MCGSGQRSLPLHPAEGPAAWWGGPREQISPGSSCSCVPAESTRLTRFSCAGPSLFHPGNLQHPVPRTAVGVSVLGDWSLAYQHPEMLSSLLCGERPGGISDQNSHRDFNLLSHSCFPGVHVPSYLHPGEVASSRDMGALWELPFSGRVGQLQGMGSTSTHSALARPLSLLPPGCCPFPTDPRPQRF